MFRFMYYVGDLYFKKIGSLSANKYCANSNSTVLHINNRNQQLMKDKIDRWLEKNREYYTKNKDKDKFTYFPTLNNKVGTSYLHTYLDKENDKIVLNKKSQFSTLSYIFGYTSIPIAVFLIYIYSKKR